MKGLKLAVYVCINIRITCKGNINIYAHKEQYQQQKKSIQHSDSSNSHNITKTK